MVLTFCCCISNCKPFKSCVFGVPESVSGTSRGLWIANKNTLDQEDVSDFDSMPSLTGQEEDIGTSSSDITADEDSDDDRILLYKQCCLRIHF